MVDVRVQTMYREAEAQTYPWEPPYVQVSEELPEVLLLNNLKWGRGLPAGQYEVEEITRSRKKRAWEMYLASVQKTTTIGFKKKIISQIESDDWEFIAEDLEKINERRMELAHQVLNEQKINFDSKLSKKIDHLNRKILERYEDNVKRIRVERDKEIRRINNIMKSKFVDRHEKRTIIDEFGDKLSDKYAFKVRLGYQRKNKSVVLCDDAYNKARDGDVKHRKFSPPNRSGKVKKHNCLREQFVEAEENEFDNYFKKIDYGFEFDNEQQKKSRELNTVREEDLVPSKQDVPDVRSEASEKHEEWSEADESLEDPMEVERKRQVFLQALKHKCLEHNQKATLNKEISNIESSLLARLLDLTSKEQQRLEEEKRILAMALIAQAERWKREARQDGIRQKQKMRETIRMHILDEAFERIKQDLEDEFQDILRDSIMETAIIEEEEIIRTKMYDIDRTEILKTDDGLKQEEMIAKLTDHVTAKLNFVPEEKERSLTDLGEINEAVQNMYQDIISIALELDNFVSAFVETEDKSSKLNIAKEKVQDLLEDSTTQPALQRLMDQVENIHLEYQLHSEIDEDIKKMDKLCDTVVEIADDLYQTVLGEIDVNRRSENLKNYSDGIVNDDLLQYLNKDTTLYIFKLLKWSHIFSENNQEQMLNNSYKIINKAKKLCKNVTTIAAKIHFFININEYEDISLVNEFSLEGESVGENDLAKQERLKAMHTERLCDKLLNKLTSKDKKKDKEEDKVKEDPIKVDICQIKNEAAQIIESIVEIWLQIDSLVEQLTSNQTADKQEMLTKLTCIVEKLEERFGNLNEFLGIKELQCLVEPDKCDENTQEMLKYLRYTPETLVDDIVDTITDTAVQLHNKRLERVLDLRHDFAFVKEPLKSDIVTMIKDSDDFVAISNIIE